MNSLLCNLLCVYALLKNIFGYDSNHDFQKIGNKRRFCLRFIFISLTLFTCLLMVCLLLPLVIFYNMVDLYLRIKLGSVYGGLLKRQDTYMQAVRDKAVMHAIVIFNENKEAKVFLESYLDNAKNFHMSSYKLSSTVRNCLGYYYYHKHQIKFEDIVEEKVIGDGEYITRDAFVAYVSKLPHPQAEKRLWSLSYFPQPILWNNKSKTTNQYAIIMSFQHCLADGPNLMRHMTKYFIDDFYKPPQTNTLINLSKDMSKFSIDDVRIFENPFNKIPGIGLPKLNKNVHESYLAICWEDTEKYLNLMKAVKGKLGVGFTSVLMGALCSSLTDYIRKKQQPFENMVFFNTIRPEEINLVFKSREEDPLMNDVGFQIIKIPATQAALSISENIRSINESLKQVRRSVDSTFMYNMVSILMPILPSIIQTKIIGLTRNCVSAVITNMSGVKNLVVAGHGVESTFFYLSSKLDLPFTFCIMSLDGRLHISLRSSGKYVSNSEELQEIVDRTLRSIDQLAKEL